MPKSIADIKKIIKAECERSGHLDPWFYAVHLLGVERWAKILLSRLPRADRRVVMLGVWLHDIQRVRGLKGDHAKAGAAEAVKMLKSFGYDAKTAARVRDMILAHRCDNVRPKTLEGKILASADALSHYVNDFYLAIGVTGKRNIKEYKEWALEKLERDYRKKIFFPFARKMIKKRHEAIKYVLTMG